MSLWKHSLHVGVRLHYFGHYHTAELCGGQAQIVGGFSAIILH